MTSASEFILNFLVNSTWQVVAIGALAALGAWLLKNGAAHYRHTIWIASLCLSLIAPLITATQVVPALPVSFGSYEFAATGPIAQESTSVTDDEAASLNHTRRRNSQVVLSTTERIARIVAAAYLLFIALAAVRFVRLWVAKEKLRRSVRFDGLSEPEMLTLRHCMALFGVERVQLARSQWARVPYTLGLKRPLIVLPESFCGDVDQETLLSVIGHEMAHVRRRDFLTKLMCELLSLPISFHPLTSLIKRQIERERELACDELVTRYVLSPEKYARSLLLAADLAILPAPAAVMLSVFDGRMLEERIRHLKRQRVSFNSWVGRPITTAVVAALCLTSVFGSAFGFSLRSPLDIQTSVPTPTVSATIRSESVSEPIHQVPVPVTRRPDSLAAQELSAQDLAQTACEATRNKDLEAIPSLIAMLRDERKTELLTCWGTRWSPALETFKHASPGEQAALALASMGRPAFVPLMNQLDSSNAATRRNAAWAIGELTNMIPGERGGAIPQLITLLSDADPWVRMAAARAIGEVGDRRASETLIVTLSDSDWRVRRLAAWALNEMKESKAVAALGNLLLNDSRAEVRLAAAEALGEIGSAVALPSLNQGLNDSAADVRAKVRWAIAEIQG